VIGPWTFSAGDISLALVKDHGGRMVTVIAEPAGDRVRIWAEGRGRLEGDSFCSRHGGSAESATSQGPEPLRIPRSALACKDTTTNNEGNLGTMLICPECLRALEGVRAPQGAALLNLPLHFRPLREDIAMAIESTGLLSLRS
jgi:hypothetical protein